MRTRASLALTAFLAAAAPAAAQTTGVPEPPDYRTDDYRAPVPATVTGGRAIATDEAECVGVRVIGCRTGRAWKSRN